LELLKGQSWHSKEFQNVTLGIGEISSINFLIKILIINKYI
jgi:hypothetical protein